MAIYHTFNLFFKHPLTKNRPIASILKFVVWQVFARIFNASIIHNFTIRAKLIIAKGMTGATGNLYFGLHEFEEMSFLLHFLRKDDVFFDAGANVGSYTVLASAHVGAVSFTIEPVPQTYNHILKNIAINNIDKQVKTYNLGLGSKAGNLNFTKSLDTVNHIATNYETDVISVPISTVDSMLDGIVPILIKIDVEGYETEVLNGASKTLENKEFKAIIIELNGSGTRYGFDEKEIHQKLLNMGFLPYKYYPFERKLVLLSTFGSYNTIYLRDLDFIQTRIKNAEIISVNNIRF